MAKEDGSNGWIIGILYAIAIGVNVFIVWDQYMADGEMRTKLSTWWTKTTAKIKREIEIDERVEKESGAVVFEAMQIVDYGEGLKGE
jgi:uncharacterized membrane protein